MEGVSDGFFISAGPAAILEVEASPGGEAGESRYMSASRPRTNMAIQYPTLMSHSRCETICVGLIWRPGWESRAASDLMQG